MERVGRFAFPLSRIVQEATELALRAVVEARIVDEPGGWAMPAFDAGVVTAGLVARFDEIHFTTQARANLRASAGLVEPLLRHWRQGDRGLLRHASDELQVSVAKFLAPVI